MLADLRAAVAFLTLLPVGWPEGRKAGYAFAWFPLVGLLVGGALALVATYAPPDLRAYLTLLVWVVLTGGLHLDGFGDSCDGLIATTTPERRLEILKDPRAGSWAVIGLGLLLLGKWTAVPLVPPPLLIAAAAAGRWSMVAAAYAFPYARSGGLGGYFREGLGRTQLLIASLTSLLIIAGLMAAGQTWAGAALIIAPLLVLLVGRWAAGRLGGGLTGDVYGALCELTEWVCLLVWAWGMTWGR